MTLFDQKPARLRDASLPERPIWIREFQDNRMISPSSVRLLKRFLKSIPESTARAYCENFVDYDQIMKTEDQPNMPLPRMYHNAVAWYGLDWAEFTHDLRQQFQNHIANLEPKKLVSYLKYCRDKIGMPQQIFQNFMGIYAPNEEKNDG